MRMQMPPAGSVWGAHAPRVRCSAPRGTHRRTGKFDTLKFFERLTPTREGAGRNTRGACAPQQHSKTSTVVGSSGESLASGTSSLGRCVTNVGWMSVGFSIFEKLNFSFHQVRASRVGGYFFNAFHQVQSQSLNQWPIVIAV